jgi:hydrogenase nickel incorporation protein HypA/HybF
MHELSIALGLIESVSETAAREGAERVTAVHLRLGAMSGIVRDALEFSWELASAGTVAAGSELRIEEIPLTVYCQACLSERSPLPGHGLVCPQCGAVAATIVHGRELELVAMEIDS